MCSAGRWSPGRSRHRRAFRGVYRAVYRVAAGAECSKTPAISGHFDAVRAALQGDSGRTMDAASAITRAAVRSRSAHRTRRCSPAGSGGASPDRLSTIQYTRVPSPCPVPCGSGAQLRYICSRAHIPATELCSDFTRCMRLRNAPIGSEAMRVAESRAQPWPRRPGSCTSAASGIRPNPGLGRWCTLQTGSVAERDAPPVHDEVLAIVVDRSPSDSPG